ncbi:aldehyde dehydrogenase [Desulfovibrio falkowii]|uniref:aldehyde dehydrogenase n=1 Tax=Desulfovibrio sp. WGS1351 TaxID=3366814 RepID=UPI00372D62F8
MSKFLTCQEYENLASQLHYPTLAFIDGKFVPAASGKTFVTGNPATGKELAHIASCGKEDVDRAVAVARKTFESGVWSKMHPTERKKIFLRLCSLMEKHMVELAVLESLDSGKPIRENLCTDLPETIECLEWHAEYTDKQYGSISPSGDLKRGLVVREPAGVVACVLPWNFPLQMVGWKLGPALSEGNSVIIKPASVTTLSTLRLAELAAEAGIPEGVLQVLPGPGGLVGEALGRHMDVDVLSFTGSTEVGRRFLQYSAESNLKRVVLELGGKSPFVLLEDVTDLTHAAEHACSAAFWNMGENCTANSRIIVPENKKDPFLEAFLAALSQWKMGNPLDPANALGSIVSEQQFKSVMGYIDKGKAEGGRIVTGGKAAAIGSGLFIEPTIFDNVSRDATIVREEIFGPVTAILTASSDEDALALANDTCYGLHASIFTESLTKAHTFASALKAGTVSVNCFSEGDNSTPFGGYRLSGFGGKDKGRESHDQYTEQKTIFINLDR